MLKFNIMLDAGIGTIIWTSIAFLSVFFIISKFAWGPILKSLKEREDHIEGSLAKAEEAQMQLSNIQAKSEETLKEARAEREKIIKDAKEYKTQMIADAKDAAGTESKKLIAQAQQEINIQKSKAIEELKQEVAAFSVQIAEKLVKNKLEDSKAQKGIIDTHLSNLSKAAN